MLNIIFFILIWTNLGQTNKSLEPSPCPKIFQYEKNQINEFGRWSGYLTITTNISLSELYIRVLFDKPVKLETNFQGTVNNGPTDYLFTNSSYIFNPFDTLKIFFTVHYSNSDSVPHIQKIVFNGFNICPGHDRKSIFPKKVSSCNDIIVVNDTKINGKWFGTILLESHDEINTILVNLQLDSPGEILGSKLGPVETSNNKEYLIKSDNFTINSNYLIEVPIFVKYSLIAPIPNINRIQMNGVTKCQNLDSINQFVSDNSNTSESSNNTIQLKNNTSNNFNLPKFECGKLSINERVLSNVASNIEKHPWHGAIYHNNEYACGISLISPYHALTAAHCFYNNENELVNLTSINIYFGLSNLGHVHLLYKQRKSFRIDKLFIHPNYKYHIAMYDIAVVKLHQPVRLNERKTPVCLWEQETEFQTVVNKTGIVLGFGLAPIGVRQLYSENILVVDKDICRDLNPEFYAHLLNRYTFCAGNLKKSTICLGDSGGGIFFKKPGSDIWQIRGIISTTRSDGLKCDKNYYVIFTDVAIYREWIQQQMIK